MSKASVERVLLAKCQRLADPARVRALSELREFLNWMWLLHPCTICGAKGPCPHREPESDMARAEGWLRRLRAGGTTL